MLSDWAIRLRALFRRAQVEHDLDDELRFHVERQVEHYMAAGLDRPDALRRARLELGGVERTKEQCRDERGIHVIDDLWRDLQYAARQFRKSPGFAALAILCLGLGIGVNTSVFSVLNALLLRPWAVTEPDRLVTLRRGADTHFSYLDARDYDARSRLLVGVATTWPMESDLDVDGDSAFVGAEVVSANYGEVAGAELVLGRWFRSDTEPVAVISDAVWQRRFNRDPSILGRRIRSQAETYTIVGVAPPDFTGMLAPIRTDLWVPVGTRLGMDAILDDRERNTMMLLGRLTAGATAARASAELTAIDRRLTAEHGRASERTSPLVVEEVRGVVHPSTRDTARLVMLFEMVVALVLAIACVNVANLLLVRGAARQGEFAMRRALGASRIRLVQQLLAESLLLALGGGLCGLVLARWTNDLLGVLLAGAGALWPRQLNLSLDMRVIAFATAISLLTTILCGLLPWRASSPSISLRGGSSTSRMASAGDTRLRRRPVAFVAQVAISLVLLLLAAMFLQTLWTLHTTDPGFAVTRRFYAPTFVPNPRSTKARGLAFYRRALERVTALPGVERAALTQFMPFWPSPSECVSNRNGHRIRVERGAVDAGFFETMGIPLASGRDFDRPDVATRAPVVIVNERLRDRLWPGRSPVGDVVEMGCDQPVTATVVGVARNSSFGDMAEQPGPLLYVPLSQHYSSGLVNVVIETRTDPAATMETVRREIKSLGQGVRVYTVEPLSDHVERSYWQLRWVLWVLGGFGLLALLLAAVGLYGVIAYRVVLRTREMGIRLALGAPRGDIFRTVMVQGLTTVLIGVAIGEVVMALLAPLIVSLRPGVRPPDLSIHLATALIWVVVGGVACYLPAARAARLDPMEVLRRE